MTEREKLINLLSKYINCSFGDKDEKVTVEEIIALLKAQESVICCRDCMYWKSDMLTHFWKPCDVVSTDKDWYCPCGRR